MEEMNHNSNLHISLLDHPCSDSSFALIAKARSSFSVYDYYCVPVCRRAADRIRSARIGSTPLNGRLHTNMHDLKTIVVNAKGLEGLEGLEGPKGPHGRDRPNGLDVKMLVVKGIIHHPVNILGWFSTLLWCDLCLPRPGLRCDLARWGFPNFSLPSVVSVKFFIRPSLPTGRTIF